MIGVSKQNEPPTQSATAEAPHAPREPLSYERPEDRRDAAAASAWDAVAGFAVLAPFLTLPLFVYGTFLLQDVIGGGPPWQPAAVVAGLPAALISAAAMVASIRVIVRSGTPCGMAITGTALNAIVLGIIVFRIVIF